MPANKDKKTGKWNSTFYYTDWTGKKIKKMKRGFATKSEALDWERHFQLEKASNLDMTFGDFYNRYKEDVQPKVRENTWRSKEYVIEQKILPYFKDLVMRDIKPRDVLAWQNEMRELSTEDGKSFSGTYLRTMQAQLSAIFNHAVKYYELPKNPAVLAGPLGQHNADEMLFWTKDEYMTFIPAMANKTYSYMAFELLYWCGVRMGELFALTPADFDFERKKVSITKSYQRIRGKDVITKPKTAKSIRVLITLNSKYKNTTSIDTIEQGMNSMEMAIKNTIRNVDICTRYSSVQFLVVLLESGNENVDNIMKRVFSSFYKMYLGDALVPEYEARLLSDKNN